mgnify:CR=1 FL=1
MLATNAELERFAHAAAAFRRDPNQITHAGLVERDKRILLENPLLDIVGHELAGIVA